jgi:quinohemoprotein ethanol dehydrogenase
MFQAGNVPIASYFSFAFRSGAAREGAASISPPAKWQTDGTDHSWTSHECVALSASTQGPIRAVAHTHTSSLRSVKSRWIKMDIYTKIACAATLISLLQSEASAAFNRTDLTPLDPADWPSYGRTASEARFSPLAQISRQNVKSLGLSWSLTLTQTGGLEATPLAIDGVLYFTAPNSTVYAVDVPSKRVLWQYDPQVWKFATDKLRMMEAVNRGVAYFHGKIYVGSFDGRLIALDAKSGHEVWQVSTLDSARSRKTITGAPRVFNGKVVIGQGGADFGTRGYVTAYDAESGKLVWRFFTVPGEPGTDGDDATMKMAAKTWNGEWWRWGGGGTVWNALTYDAELNQLYIGVGNSSVYNPRVRSPGGGDNLFLSSIVALNADTGKYLWHYQVNPMEAWDFKATADIVLADLVINGSQRKVLMQAPTNGFFYVIERRSGKLLSAEKTGKVTWADHVDLKTGRPVEAPDIRYENGPSTFWPSAWGTHNWQAMSYSPITGLVYIPYMQLAGTYESSGQDIADLSNVTLDRPNLRFGIGGAFHGSVIDKDDGTGALLAWDPVSQKPRWRVRLEHMWNGGTLTTAGGLVFQGTADGKLIAYSADRGDRLWEFAVGNGIMAAPISFAAKGVQYIAVLAGYGGTSAAGGPVFDMGWRFGIHPGRLLLFALHANETLPETKPPTFTVQPVDSTALNIDEEAARDGFRLYNRTCIICHGYEAVANGPTAPDLRASGAALDFLSFKSILHGALNQAGMPSFNDFSDEEAREVFMYIRSQARKSIREAQNKRATDAQH